MTDWVERLLTLSAAGPVAMVSVLATEGSAPRGAGATVSRTSANWPAPPG